ncbi:hypothetical protein BGZ99_008306 [Dissophora globulifera]|uniref:Lysosomal dipeptide transporter MFSD1 n=1 Tax=Dissophora globulifera TaxID=979702 RepID=A0A9P6R9W1_9FUNG|nr:hypothetical protein BGZ99_008306 [Dissophora globulifera]
MSDSRIDYQPLYTEAIDSPSYHRLSHPPDTPGHHHSTGQPRVDDDNDYDDDGIHATENQELVDPSQREFTDHLRRQQEHDDNGNGELDGAKAAAEWGIQLQAFFCAALLGVSTHYTLHMAGPLKDVLKEVCNKLGAAPITIIQETIWVRYFRKDGLALVLALGLTSGKLAGFLATATSVPLAMAQPFGFVTPFIVSLIISLIAWVMNIVFLMLLKKPKEGADAMTKITILLKAKRTNLGWREVYGFSSMFWTMLIISFLVGASWNPFMHQASNLVKHRYGYSDQQAGWEASVILAVPLIVYPFLGKFIDHAGKRAWLLLVTAALLVSTHFILLLPYSAVPIPPTIPILLFAFSLALGTLSIVTSMPLLTKHVPTGLGLHKSIDNIGATLFGTISGMLQDFSGIDVDGETDTQSFFDRLYHHFFPEQVDQAQQEREDTRLLGMFLAVAILLLIVCAIFVWGDYHWTDGEGGKTGIVNGVYGKREAIKKRSTRIRRSRRRRSHEVLEAMTLEPIFELTDELDAEEVSLAEIGSSSLGFHSSNQHGPVDVQSAGRFANTSGFGTARGHRRESLDEQQEEDDDDDNDDELEEDSQDESGEYRFGVRIESGDDDVPHRKKVQARFWIIVWSVLLLASWVVFGVGVSR